MSNMQVKEGWYALPEITAFLSGIFFTALLLLFQCKEKYIDNIIIFNVELPINPYIIISLSLTVTTILFMWCTIFLGFTPFASSNLLEARSDYALNLFMHGIYSMNISLFIILLLINRYIAVIGIILSIFIVRKWFNII